MNLSSRKEGMYFSATVSWPVKTFEKLLAISMKIRSLAQTMPRPTVQAFLAFWVAWTTAR